MPKAIPTHTTSSRRSLLAHSTAAAATVARAAPLPAPGRFFPPVFGREPP
jgi:hypothetical protein